MGADRMDELFRSALGKKESEVSTDSWSKLEMMLDHQPVKEKKASFYGKSIAASLLLLLVSSLVYWFAQPEEQWVGYQHAFREPIHPKKIELAAPIQLQMSPVVLQGVQVAATPVMATQEVKQSDAVVAEESIIVAAPEQILAELDVPIELEEERAVAIQTSQESEEVIPVKVTYKKTPAEPQLADGKERKSLKQIIEQARGIDTMEVWADIRAAKDKVLDDPFGIQKSQRQKLK